MHTTPFDVKSEIVAQLTPPTAWALIERVHFMTHINAAMIQKAIWELVAANIIEFDIDLRLKLRPHEINAF